MRSPSVAGQPPPLGSLLSVKLLAGVASALPDHGVRTVPAVFGPQIGGLVSIPFGPPFMRSLKELNVACGLSSTTAVS